MIALVPKLGDYQRALRGMLNRAEGMGRTEVAINAVDLDGEVVGYPGADHRMAMCCNALVAEMWFNDECHRLNSTPRKCLGYNTLVEDFEAKLIEIQNQLR